MRTSIALLFALISSLAVGQTTAPKDAPTGSQLVQQQPAAPPSRLSQMLAQVDPADKKTFECTCTDAVDKTKTNKATCNKGETCKCSNGTPSCTKQ
jgi:hypothetical protein